MSDSRARLQPATLGRHLRRARVVIYVLLFALVLYHVWRYDLVQLPPGGVSPLEDVQPGSRLIVDVHPTSLVEGDAVLYRDTEGVLLLGRIRATPPSAPEEIWEACRRGALWVLKDRPEVPGADSLLLGPIQPDRIEGRVALSVPW